MKNLSTLPDLRPGRLTDDEIDALPEPKRFGLTWVYPNGMTLPVVAGAEGDDDPDDPDGDDGADPKNDRTFSQTEVSALMTRQAKKERKAANRELFESLGVKDADELKGILTGVRETQTKEASELEKAKNEAAEAKAKAAGATVESQKVLMRASIKEALIDADVLDAKARKALVPVVMAELDDEDEVDEDAITAAVETVRGNLPQLFKASDDDEVDPATGKPKTKPVKKAVSGDPGSGPRKKGGDTQTGLERGAERARAQGLSRPKADATA